MTRWCLRISVLFIVVVTLTACHCQDNRCIISLSIPTPVFP